ncbi:unnamed protein product [Spodoptera exigua]|nr:unnamed protein product [Spodoptera exigua]
MIGKRAYGLPYGMLSAPPVDTRNNRGVTSKGREKRCESARRVLAASASDDPSSERERRLERQARAARVHARGGMNRASEGCGERVDRSAYKASDRLPRPHDPNCLSTSPRAHTDPARPIRHRARLPHNVAEIVRRL